MFDVGDAVVSKAWPPFKDLAVEWKEREVKQQPACSDPRERLSENTVPRRGGGTPIQRPVTEGFLEGETPRQHLRNK